MVELTRSDVSILVVICVIVISQASHARLLHGSLQKDVPSMVQRVKLPLPGQKSEAPSSIKRLDGNHPCSLEEPTRNFESVSPVPEKVIGKYRPLLLNFLPKGTVPPSGPSKRINNYVG